MRYFFLLDMNLGFMKKSIHLLVIPQCCPEVFIQVHDKIIDISIRKVCMASFRISKRSFVKSTKTLSAFNDEKFSESWWKNVPL